MRELRAREVSLKLRYNFPKVVLISPKLEELRKFWSRGKLFGDILNSPDYLKQALIRIDAPVTIEYDKKTVDIILKNVVLAVVILKVMIL